MKIYCDTLEKRSYLTRIQEGNKELYKLWNDNLADTNYGDINGKVIDAKHWQGGVYFYEGIDNSLGQNKLGRDGFRFIVELKKNIDVIVNPFYKCDISKLFRDSIEIVYGKKITDNESHRIMKTKKYVRWLAENNLGYKGYYPDCDGNDAYEIILPPRYLNSNYLAITSVVKVLKV